MCECEGSRYAFRRLGSYPNSMRGGLRRMRNMRGQCPPDCLLYLSDLQMPIDPRTVALIKMVCFKSLCAIVFSCSHCIRPSMHAQVSRMKSWASRRARSWARPHSRRLFRPPCTRHGDASERRKRGERVHGPVRPGQQTCASLLFFPPPSLATDALSS